MRQVLRDNCRFALVNEKDFQVYDDNHVGLLVAADSSDIGTAGDGHRDSGLALTESEALAPWAVTASLSAGGLQVSDRALRRP